MFVFWCVPAVVSVIVTVKRHNSALLFSLLRLSILFFFVGERNCAPFLWYQDPITFELWHAVIYINSYLKQKIKRTWKMEIIMNEGRRGWHPLFLLNGSTSVKQTTTRDQYAKIVWMNWCILGLISVGSPFLVAKFKLTLTVESGMNTLPYQHFWA